MALTFPVDPAIGFEKFKFGLARKSLALVSPYSGKQQTQSFPYALWKVDATLSPIDCISYPVAAGKMRSFMAQLQGLVQPFSITPPGVTTPATGYNGLTGAVNGSGQTGTPLVTNGWANSAAILLEGEHFSVNGEFKVTTAVVNSDSKGNATISFMPALRASPVTATSIVTASPQVSVAADKDDVAMWDIGVPVIQSFSFTALERI